MVRWVIAILLLGLSFTALPGGVSLDCDEAMARTMGCAATPRPEPEESSCCGAGKAPAATSQSEPPACHAESAPGTAPGTVADMAEGGCPVCAIVCGALCERASPWGVLGLGSDSLAHAPVATLLPEPAWLARERSARRVWGELPDHWLTFDRPRRQAKLCLWTV